MNRKKKTALFLVDCLAHMPSQKGDVTRAVNTVVAGLTLIADGGEWPADEALAAARAASDAAWAVRAARAAWAANAAVRAAAYWTANAAAYCAVDRVADYAARAHSDPAKERARQAAKRKELGL